MTIIRFDAGNYYYVPGVFQYSAGVAALPGFRLERFMFHRPVPLAAGFECIAATLASLGRPLTAFAACELRSPEPFTEAGFRAFNEIYVGTLAKWRIYDEASRTNPVARSNVCPILEKPAEPAFHAFTITVPDDIAAPSFHIAGSGEAPEGRANYRDHIVRRGDVSTGALTEKARFVVAEMERRMGALGFGWAEATAAQVYTAHDIHPFLEREIVTRGAARCGLTWHYARPPIVELEYEMDCRCIAVERVI